MGGKFNRLTLLSKGRGKVFRLLLWALCIAACLAPIRTGTFIIPFPEKPNTADVTKKLKFAGMFGEKGRSNGQILEPKGLCFDSNGNLYVADSANARVTVFDRVGEPKDTVGHFGWDGDGFVRPRDIAIDQELYIYVSDEDRDVILQFDIYGKYLKTIGGGSEAAELDKPSGIAVDKIGNLWVCDTGNHTVKAFDNAGQVVREIGGFGWHEGRFNNPSDIAIDRHGQIYVADSGNSRIQVFDKFGNFLLSFGGREEGPGEMNFPSGICLDPKGNVYVADTGNDRLKVFLFDGSVLLAEYGYYGNSDTRLNRPTGVSVSSDGYLFVADTFNDTVKYFSITYETVLLEAWHFPRIEPADIEEPTGMVDSSGTLSDRFDDLWREEGIPEEENLPPDYETRDKTPPDTGLEDEALENADEE
jgi:DNA-binding beta-propeller fold protein YncE